MTNELKSAAREYVELNAAIDEISVKAADLRGQLFEATGRLNHELNIAFPDRIWPESIVTPDGYVILLDVDHGAKHRIIETVQL